MPNEGDDMKRLVKHFDSMSKAVRYQNKLYDQYDYVRLVKAPMFGESGLYQWDVK